MLVSASSPYEYRCEANRINAQSNSFRLFLEKCVFTSNGWRMIEMVSRHSGAYIFSGVIRDFLTGQMSEVRDVDVVVNRIDSLRHLFSILQNPIIRENEFGGLKITLGTLVVDTWQLRDTWGIIKKQSNDTPEDLVETVFFNFSAIAFDLQEKKFLVSEDFCRFSLYNELDYVYEENPNIPLCIINTLYYREKYGFVLTNRLIKWVRDHYQCNLDYGPFQRKHFGRVIYSNKEVDDLINYISHEKNRVEEIPF